MTLIHTSISCTLRDSFCGHLVAEESPLILAITLRLLDALVV